MFSIEDNSIYMVTRFLIGGFTHMYVPWAIFVVLGARGSRSTSRSRDEHCAFKSAASSDEA